MGAPYSRNKGFLEIFDKVLNDDGYDIDTPGVTLLYDVRGAFAFLAYLNNQSDGNAAINYEIFYTFKNFDDIEKDVNPLGTEEQWISQNAAVNLLVATHFTDEFVRATPRVTGVRIDLTATSTTKLTGNFSVV